MNATATPIGAAAPQVLHAERGTGRQDRTGFALSDRARRDAKHRAAVATTLRWADEAARCGDHVDALAWLDALEAIGDKLPKTYELRRDSWSAQRAT
jgi:hypothetical protein